MGILFLLAVLGQGISEKEMANGLDRLINQAAFSDAVWGIYVYDPLRDQELYALNADKNFRPASNQKIMTTVLALDRLGPDYRFETRLFCDGPISNGTLFGNLWVQGGGDPGFQTHYFAEAADDWRSLVAILQQAGIHTIRGGIGVLPGIFSVSGYLASWEWDDLGSYYGAQVSALQTSDTWLDLDLESDPNGQWQFFMDPEITVSKVEWLPAQDEVEVLWNPMDHSLRFFVPQTPCYQEAIALAHPDPEAQFLQQFRSQITEAGIHAQESGQPLPAGPIRLIGSHFSLPLGQLARVLMKESQNHYADLFWLTTAAHHQALTVEEAEAMNLHFLDTIMADLGWPATKGSQFRDGSGLSQQNNIKPRELAALLTYALRQRWADEWLLTLPIMGVDGTLETRGSDSIRARVFAKTGYINRVRTLSGYVLNAKNEPIIFSIMVNNYSCPTRLINRAQDQICAVLAQLKRPMQSAKNETNFVFPKPVEMEP